MRRPDKQLGFDKDLHDEKTNKQTTTAAAANRQINDLRLTTVKRIFHALRSISREQWCVGILLNCTTESMNETICIANGNLNERRFS